MIRALAPYAHARFALWRPRQAIQAAERSIAYAECRDCIRVGASARPVATKAQAPVNQ